MAEFMFLGLRMTQGVSKGISGVFWHCNREYIWRSSEKYKKQGLLLEESGRIFLSREGIHVSNAVMADFCCKFWWKKNLEMVDEQMFL